MSTTSVIDSAQSQFTFQGKLPSVAVAGETSSVALQGATWAGGDAAGTWKISSIIGGEVVSLATSASPGEWSVANFVSLPALKSTLDVSFPAGLDAGNYIVSYNTADAVYSGGVTVQLAASPTSGLVAPVVSNITATTADLAAPSTLADGFASYRPEVFEPSSGLWLVAGDNLLGGGSLTAGNLTPSTVGYKARFVGIPAAGHGTTEVVGPESDPFTTLDAPEPEQCAFHPLGKDISAAYKASLSDTVTTRALLYKLQRRDGLVLGFTGHDRDINGDLVLRDGVPEASCAGIVFESQTGISPTVLQSKLSTESDNMQIMAALDSEAITEADLNAGLYDYADLWLMEVNYEDLSQGALKYKRGRLGKVSFDGQKFSCDLNSLSERLGSKVVEETSLLCRVRQFGDTRCKKDLSGASEDGFALTVLGTVTSVDATSPDRRLASDDLIGFPEDRFTYGRFKVTNVDSLNYGLEVKVRSNDEEGNLVLDEPFPHPLLAGDTYQAIVGCDRQIRTCWQVFNNAINHQGEPYLPGVQIYDIQKA